METNEEHFFVDVAFKRIGDEIFVNIRDVLKIIWTFRTFGPLAVISEIVNVFENVLNDIEKKK